MRVVTLILTTLLLSGCITVGNLFSAVTAEQWDSGRINSNASAWVRSKLALQHHEWRGVRYRLGGQSKHGIDCSGFVQTTFASQFSLNLPRTTKQQATLGGSVPIGSLKPGDLVFFKIGYNQLHVGIYYGNNQFLHASSSKGVIFSSMNNRYWRPKYWKTKRILRT